ncbi:uncharacterized protein LOC118270267 isoform X1 [Spodoptera frugiperda]|uniref:Uncharacterized protein LOC118270267 isoform X1 n=1 Tax=Spodoptera frugiperda TaxID=7108 RepID=A0A9R0DW60_SPOFR|nr:uncharacterized protein LOC118270267 isoform X1 [Spodoptera frugiperda]
MGRSSDFSWLGLFKVSLEDYDDVDEIVTGIVLIKPNYALANAEDIAKIPKEIFLQHSEAMFISEGDVAVYYRPLSYVTHPEHQTAVYSSIAIVKLAVPEDSQVIPICFPDISYDSDHLYLFGYTDDNDNTIWEKVIYKIQPVDTHTCARFYKNEGLVDRQHEPESYVCGRHQYSNASCIWENGMVLASNTTGWFTLIGFSVHGPGCNVPARFIFMLHYFSWINSVTRESGRRAGDDSDEVPLHNLVKSINVPLEKNPTPVFFIRHDYIKWPSFKHAVQMKYFHLEEPTYEDPHAIAIYPFNTTQEMYWKACQSSRALIYREHFKLDAPRTSGVVRYKVSMYNLNIPACSCVTLTVQCTERSEAFLTLRDEINFTPEEGDTFGGGHNPMHDAAFQVVPVTEKMPAAMNPANISSDEIEPMKFPNSVVQYLSGKSATGKVISYDLYIQLKFHGSAVLKFQIFGEPLLRGTTSEPARALYADPFTFPSHTEENPYGARTTHGPNWRPPPGWDIPETSPRLTLRGWAGDPSNLDELIRFNITENTRVNDDVITLEATDDDDDPIKTTPDPYNSRRKKERYDSRRKKERFDSRRNKERFDSRRNKERFDSRRNKERFWGNTVKWPSLVVDDNLEHESLNAGPRLSPDPWFMSACCVILLMLFGIR